jgi:hypothetical protein
VSSKQSTFRLTRVSFLVLFVFLFVKPPHRQPSLLARFCGVFCEVKLGDFDPASIPGKPPAKNSATLEVVKKLQKWDYGTEGRFGHRFVGGQRALKSTFEASGFSQPSDQISKNRNLDLCSSSRGCFERFESGRPHKNPFLRVGTPQGVTQ